MRAYFIFLLLIPINTFADHDFVYPAPYNKDLTRCEAPVKEAYGLCSPPIKYEATYLYDLNEDGICELLVHDSHCGDNSTWYQIFEVTDKGPKHIGTTVPGDWFGEPYNGYVQILRNGYFGHKTNPSFTVLVQRYEDGEYRFDRGRPDISFGGYSNYGAEYYKKKDYNKAYYYYLNVYRMLQENNVKSANDLAITLYKMNRLEEAKKVLEKNIQTKSDKNDKAALFFNLGLIYEKENSLETAYKNYQKANDLYSTKSRISRLEKIKALLEKSEK